MILVEMMAQSLPIVSSNKGTMIEILGDNGIYFDPEDPTDIASALELLLNNRSLRLELSKANYQKSKNYSWTKCTQKTFTFFREVLDSQNSYK